MLAVKSDECLVQKIVGICVILMLDLWKQAEDIIRLEVVGFMILAQDAASLQDKDQVVIR
ncbi:hypothetical protein D3C87_1875200 [compost metagenome]